jgi:DNA-binding MarR family transcriptional regulator
VSDELQDQFHELLSRQRILVLRFAMAVHVLQALHHRLTTAQALTFLAVWAEEGLPVSVLALRCGVKPAAVSSHLRGLTARVINDEPGLGLLDVSYRQTRSDFRLRHVFLTERGHLLARRMVEIMKDNPRKRIAPMGALCVRIEPQASFGPEERRLSSHPRRLSSATPEGRRNDAERDNQ